MVRQPSSLYKRHRFPGELISHAVWLYYRFLSGSGTSAPARDR